jgi:putative transcriptional regulator
MAPSLFKYQCFLLSTLSPASAFSPLSIRPNHVANQRSRCRLEARSNERARVERKYEEMMDNDWREFRAKLVAKEKAEEVAIEAAKTKTKSTVGSSGGAPTKGEDLGELISGAFSSIFNGGKDEAKEMFKGNVGGANTNTRFTSIDFPSDCEDPFLSVDECHLIYSEPVNVEINKHRWAHPLAMVEPGCVLVANEKLGGVFHQTVVLIIDHHEKIGSTGMIINRYVKCL